MWMLCKQAQADGDLARPCHLDVFECNNDEFAYIYGAVGGVIMPPPSDWLLNMNELRLGVYVLFVYIGEH